VANTSADADKASMLFNFILCFLWIIQVVEGTLNALGGGRVLLLHMA